MLAFRLLGRRVINFADPESQKGFVYLPFLSPSSIRLFRWWEPSSPLRGLPENVFLFLSIVSPFIRSPSHYPCLSLSAPPPPILRLCSVSTHRKHPGSNRISANTMVQLRSGSDRKLQYSSSCTEKRRPKTSERYRQMLKDRINRIESKVMWNIFGSGLDATIMQQNHLSHIVLHIHYFCSNYHCKKTSS